MRSPLPSGHAGTPSDGFAPGRSPRDLPLAHGAVASRSHLAPLVAVLASVVVAPTVVALASGSFTIARNDAFSYTRIADNLHQTGRLQFISYGRMELIGHLLWLQPFLSLFHDRETAGSVAGVVSAAAATVLLLLVCARVVGIGRAVVPLLVLAVFQGVATTVPTAMTDFTALAFDAGALYCAARGLALPGRRCLRWVLPAFTLAVASFSVREFGIVLVLSVALTLAVARADVRRPVLALAAATVTVCGAIYLWHSHQSGLEPSAFRVSPQTLALTAGGFCTLGLGLLPVTLVHAPRLVAACGLRWPLAVGLTAGVGSPVVSALLPGFSLVATGRKALADDVYTRWGASGRALAVGGRPTLFGQWAWVLLNAAACVGSILLGLALAAYITLRLTGRHSPTSEPLNGRVVLLLETTTGLHLLVVGAFGLVTLFNDRYLWLAAPLLATLLIDAAEQVRGAAPAIDPGRRTRLFAVCASWLVLAVVALAVAQDSAAYDAARWRGGTRLVALGLPAAQVDAGLEWVGAHSSAVRNINGHAGRPETLDDPYYEGFWAPTARCGVVYGHPPDPSTFTVAGLVRYRSRLWTTVRTLWLARRRTCG